MIPEFPVSNFGLTGFLRVQQRSTPQFKWPLASTATNQYNCQPARLTLTQQPGPISQKIRPALPQTDDSEGGARRVNIHE